MSEHVPELIDPLALVEKRRQFKGAVPLSRLLRLHDLLVSLEGDARFELSFTKEGRVAAVLGKVEADLQLQCQCCLRAIPWCVSSKVRLGIVRSIDEANLLPESFEPLLLEQETIPLADIVQDELLLAIPPIPQHSRCDWALNGMTRLSEERSNPFAVLADFKKMNLQ